MNLPNKITLARIFMTIIVIFLCLFPFYSLGINFPKYNVSGIIVDLKYIIAGVLFIIAAATDFVDGNFHNTRSLKIYRGAHYTPVITEMQAHSAPCHIFNLFSSDEKNRKNN